MDTVECSRKNIQASIDLLMGLQWIAERVENNFSRPCCPACRGVRPYFHDNDSVGHTSDCPIPSVIDSLNLSLEEK